MILRAPQKTSAVPSKADLMLSENLFWDQRIFSLFYQKILIKYLVIINRFLKSIFYSEEINFINNLNSNINALFLYIGFPKKSYILMKSKILNTIFIHRQA